MAPPTRASCGWPCIVGGKLGACPQLIAPLAAYSDALVRSTRSVRGAAFAVGSDGRKYG